MKILAIDPGSMQSGWVMYCHGKVLGSGVESNRDVLRRLTDPTTAGAVDTLAVEHMRARGMPTSNDEFETLVWVGRFIQAWHDPDAVRLVYRADVKLHVCGSAKATDTNIRAALLDSVGPQGRKSAPGPTYGVKSHGWAALGVAVTAAEQMKEVG